MREFTGMFGGSSVDGRRRSSPLVWGAAMVVVVIALALLLIVSSLERIETGKAGLRVTWNGLVEPVELNEGSINQTIIGDVLKFSVKDIFMDYPGLTPQSKDGSTMKQVDITVVYSIVPSAVDYLWTQKSSGFHSTTKDGDDYFLMYGYVGQVARNALYKSAQEYDALDMNLNRSSLEESIKTEMRNTLQSEGLADKIIIVQVMVRQIVPAASVVAAATALVAAHKDDERKEVEVGIAKKEAARIAALNSNAKAIEYINAQANMTIAEAVKEGKVHTILFPYDFKGMVSVTK